MLKPQVQKASFATVKQIQSTFYRDKEDNKIQDKDYCENKAKQDSELYMLTKMVPNLKKQVDKQLQIVCKVSSQTFSGDKIVRLISNVLKLTRNFNLVTNLKPLEKIIYQITQLRRLLRINRLCLIFRDYYGCLKKQKLTKLDYYMLFFRGLLLYQDCNDVLSYMIQMKIVSFENLLPQLRKNISDLYFFECIGWLIYYSYEYIKSQTVQLKKRNRIAIIRYILDTVISHNDYSKRKGTLDLRIISILGIISSLLNLSLVWN